MARSKKSLRGTKTSGNWWDKHENRSDGKRCEVTGNAGRGPKGSRVDIRDIKECASVCKSHFFDKDTMRFFNSRVGDTAYLDGNGGAFFTTSEKGPNNVRAYSVRHYDPERCGVDTVGKFQSYHSMGAAQTAAKRMATKGVGLGRRRRKR